MIRRELTFAALRDGDVIEDARGEQWMVSDVVHSADQVSFTITSGDRTFHPIQPHAKPVAIYRPEETTVADVTAAIEAVTGDSHPLRHHTTDPLAKKVDHPFQPDPSGMACEFDTTNGRRGSFQCGLSAGYHSDDLLDAAVTAATALPAEVVDEASTEEVRQADAATAEAPARVPAFADLDIMAKRGHLFRFHGVFARDIQTTAELTVMHDQATLDHIAGRLQAEHTPHVHDESKGKK